MRAVRRPATGERVPVQVPGPGPTPATGRAYSPDGRGACLALLLAALLVATPAAAIVAASAPQSVTVSDLALQLHGVTLVSRDSAAQELSRSTQASTLDVNTLVGPQMLCTGYAPGSGQVVPPSCDPAAVPGFISPGGILILSRELDTTEIRQTITNTDTDRTTGTNLLSSRSTRGPLGCGGFDSFHPLLSADGTPVAFSSFADDLDPLVLDANRFRDVYLHTRP